MAIVLAVVAAFVVQIGRIVTSARNGRHRTLIVVGNLAYALALLAFVFPPASPTNQNELVVLTPYASASERRLANRAQNVVALGDVALDATERRRIAHVPDTTALRAARPDARAWRVLGAGLPPSANADNINVRFDAPNSPEGIVEASWPQSLAPGATFEVHGSVTTSDLSGHIVSLVDPSGDVAAATPLDSDGHFALSAPTRAAGATLFKLALRAADETLLEAVPLPVDLRSPSPLRVWVRTASPSFEIRYLKDWARRGNARMVLDTMLSREKPRREYINQKGPPAGALGLAELANYDLLVLDARALEGLTETELSAVTVALAQDQIGVIVIGASEPTRSAQLGGPPTAATPTTSRAVALPGASGTQVHTSARFSESTGQVLLRTLDGMPLAKRTGSGDHALVITLIDDSFRWVTAGQSETHTAYWKTLIDGALTAQPQPIVTTLPTSAYAHKRQLLCIRHGRGDTVEVQADDAQPITLSLSPLPERPGELCALNYPRAGWHSVRMNGQDIARRFVLSPGDWSTRQRLGRREHTLRLSALTPSTQASATTDARWPRWPFALICLLLAAALWFEQRRVALRSD